MKHLYSLSLISTVTLMIPLSTDQPALITYVHTQPRYRGQGSARQVMSEVLEDADNEGWTLMLSVQPDGKLGSLSYEMLKVWYERLGFKMLPGGDEVTMERIPLT